MKIDWQQIFATLIILGSVLTCGCHSEHLTQGNGDAGQFILQRALAYGGRPIATNSLSAIGSDWQYVQDKFGVGTQLSATQFPVVDNYLMLAFGPPSSKAGWAARDVGVAIYLEIVGSNTVVSVHPPMSDEQLAQMWRKISDTIKKNAQ